MVQPFSNIKESSSFCLFFVVRELVLTPDFQVSHCLPKSENRRILIPLHMISSTGKIFLIRPSEIVLILVQNCVPRSCVRQVLGKGVELPLVLTGGEASLWVWGGKRPPPPPTPIITSVLCFQDGGVLPAGWAAKRICPVGAQVRAGGGTLRPDCAQPLHGPPVAAALLLLTQSYLTAHICLSAVLSSILQEVPLAVLLGSIC